jgi:Tfp pilus assembly protein PilF
MLKKQKLFIVLIAGVVMASCMPEDNTAAKSHFDQAFSYIATSQAAASDEQKRKLLENAEKEFLNALKINPEYFDARMNLGVLYVTQGKLNMAEREYEKAYKLNPNDGTLLYNQAAVYSLTGRVDLGLERLDLALSNNFMNINALRNDPDIEALRKNASFKPLVEKHSLFLGN